MKKKKFKKSKFKIPSKPGKKKIVEEEFDYFDETDPEMELLEEKYERAITVYQAILRHFFNSLVPEDMKISDYKEFTKFFEIKNYGYFSLGLINDDVLFSFMGSNQPVPLEFILKNLVEETAENFKHRGILYEPEFTNHLKTLRSFGIKPGDRKVLFIVQEEPTKEFLNRDEIVIDRNDEFFMDYTGEWADYIIDYFNKDLGTTDVLVKVINKENNPEVYKDYLKLKHITDRMKELRVEMGFIYD